MKTDDFIYAPVIIAAALLIILAIKLYFERKHER